MKHFNSKLFNSCFSTSTFSTSKFVFQKFLSIKIQTALSLKKVLLTLGLLTFLACQTTVPALPLSKAPKTSLYSPKGEYILAPLDEVKIAAVGDTSFDGVYTLSEDGSIQLPLAGSVIISKKTLSSALESVTKAASPYLKEPNLTMTLVAKKSYRAFFGGEFTRVGMIVLDSPTNLLSAISLAGGLTPYASGRLVLIRKTPEGMTKRFEVLHQDLKNGRENFDEFIMERGDFILAE
jgi:polysaccharide export outer membrane protein